MKKKRQLVGHYNTSTGEVRIYNPKELQNTFGVRQFLSLYVESKDAKPKKKWWQVWR